MTNSHNKFRESNFELLRIFAMILIVWNHICMHGVWLKPTTQISFNLIISKSFSSWTGILGNYLFIFTSGYFLSSSVFSWRKIFKLWTQVFFISVSIGLIFYIWRIQKLTANVDINGFSDWGGGTTV